MWINFKEKYKINSFKLTLILSVGLFIIYSIWIRKMPSPYFTDEVGYWGCAAHMAGVDWTSVTSKMAYFGYGYGIFLFPLFLLGDSELIYEAALFLNIFFVECVFWMLISILNKMFSKKYEMENILCAFVGCLYSASIVYSHTTMSEICILFFLVLLVMLVQNYCESPKIIYGGLISAVLFELLAIHLRNLIFVVIVLLFMLFLMIVKKKDARNSVITVFFIVGAVVLAILGKRYFTTNVFTDVVTNTHIDANDNVSVRLWFVGQLFNIEWWKNYFINVLCKSFYLVLSSLFVIVFAVEGLIGECRKPEKLSEKLFSIFLLLLCVCSILYGSLIMFSGGGEFRIDTLLYGRYTECIMPIFCSIGLMYFLKKEKSHKYYRIYLIVAMVVLLVSKIAYSYYKSNNIFSSYTNIMPLQIAGISWLLKDKPENILHIVTFLAALVYLLLAVIIYFFLNNRWLTVVTIGGCWIVFAYMGWNAFGLNLNETMDIPSMSRVERMEKISEISSYLQKLDCDEVYYVFDPESEEPDYYDMFTLQFDLVKGKLLPIAGDEISDVIDDGIIVVSYCSDYYDDIKNKYEIQYKNDLFIVAKGDD